MDISGLTAAVEASKQQPLAATKSTPCEPRPKRRLPPLTPAEALHALAAATDEHARSLDDAAIALKQARQALERSGGKAAEIGRLLPDDLPSFEDWVSRHGVWQIDQLLERIQTVGRGTSNFRARVANRADAARRASKHVGTRWD